LSTRITLPVTLWGTLSGETPFILTVWGTDIEDALRGRFMIAPTVRRVLRRASFITSASRFLIDRTIALEASVADKITCIPFGVPIPEISIRKPIDEVEGVIHIVYTKTFRPAYAPDLALVAFARAYREDPRLRLTMIGGGPLKQTLRDMAGQLGISDSANIRGWQDMQETRRLIESADIMLMPSRQESFGVAALEATSHGVPVVATRVGGLPEIIENGINGILVPVDDVEAVKKALLELAANPRLRHEMGRAGQEMSRDRYDFEKCLDMMEDLYRRALAS
jgi:glycosyltransferase involved in cell wall biosynthesis